MSEFYTEVVRIGKITKHPDADSLSITDVLGGYPCIIKTGDFVEGQLAVYLSVDTLCPLDNPLFAFLAKSGSPKSLNGKQYARIKAVKLRGIFSMGLLIPADPGWEEGQNVSEFLGIEKYEPLVTNTANGGRSSTFPGELIHYDIEGIRKYENLLQENEQVVVLEKVDGQNSSFVYTDTDFVVCSHNQKKERPLDSEPVANWWQIAAKYDIERKLEQCRNLAVYGEVYGYVSDLRYGTKPGELLLAIFDVLDIRNRRWLNWDDVVELANELELPLVPELYRGCWKPELKELSEGKTTINKADHIREGIVVKPLYERTDRKIGRVILKLHGTGYLLRKEK